MGWSSSSSNAPTCTPSGGMTLVADAVARGADGWYRVRYWRLSHFGELAPDLLDGGVFH
ncbi:MAG: hypothetical protein R3C56_08390 [Pirellulaceae bacterium]